MNGPILKGGSRTGSLLPQERRAHPYACVMADDAIPDGDPLNRETQEDASENAPVLSSVSFQNLSSTDFEEFCFDLMKEIGFVNVDWRKGTPKDASPSDRGRDIVAQLERKDVDGHLYYETWFVDCKHYKTGVPPDALQGLISWAQVERPAVVLVIASGFLSNGSKDWMESYRTNNKPPFRLRHWERPQLGTMLKSHVDLAFRHDVSVSSLRSVSEIMAAEGEAYEQVWYGRKPDDHFGDRLEPKLKAALQKAMMESEQKFGLAKLEDNVKDDFSWGFINGKLSTLRWILGDEWDSLDT